MLLFLAMDIKSSNPWLTPSRLEFNIFFLILSVLKVCVSEEHYKKAICNILPKLKTLDGEFANVLRMYRYQSYLLGHVLVYSLI